MSAFHPPPDLNFLLFCGGGLFLMGAIFRRKDGRSLSAPWETLERLFQEWSAEDFPEVAVITAPELADRLGKEQLFIVDVRSPEERAVSTLPGAVSVEDFESDADCHAGSTIVAYCTAGYRSGMFAKGLRGKNFRVFNLKGGVLAWAHAGQPFSAGEHPTLKVHVYKKRWNLLPEKYTAVW